MGGIAPMKHIVDVTPPAICGAKMPSVCKCWGCGGGSINSVTKPPGQHIANHCSFMYLRKKLSRPSEDKHASTLSGACRLPHWDPGSPSSRVPAFLLARSKINLLRLADASGARG